MSEFKKYYCKENDNHLIFVFEDEVLEEIHVGDALEKAWIIIGYKDFQEAFKNNGVEFKKLPE